MSKPLTGNTKQGSTATTESQIKDLRDVTNQIWNHLNPQKSTAAATNPPPTVTPTHHQASQMGQSEATSIPQSNDISDPIPTTKFKKFIQDLSTTVKTTDLSFTHIRTMIFFAAFNCKMNNYDPKVFQSTMDQMYTENGFPTTLKIPKQIMTKEYIDGLAPMELPNTNNENLRSITRSVRPKDINSKANRKETSTQSLDTVNVFETIQQSPDLSTSPDDTSTNWTNTIARELDRENESLQTQSFHDMFASQDDAITNKDSS